ncbi:MAG: UDP-2,3-diacylglucosamine diphosphatase [Saprospiraceae bacterium]|nr:UDP-2,3-diacylglucosamine diphosphatase [Saprospiraceae bacterium]
MKKIYFASDFHLGIPNLTQSHLREAKIVRWLTSIQDHAERIFLVGDIFDFWFEYKTVVPKGYLRLLGKLAELRSKGIAIDYFTGNHDIWMFEYLDKELGIKIHRKPLYTTLKGKKFLIGHGDGLGPKDKGYKFLKKYIFNNRLCQWLFRWFHPDLGIRLALFFSQKSRNAQKDPEVFKGEEDEWLLAYAKRKVDQDPGLDYCIFGHRHLPLDLLLSNQRSRYINLGEWLDSFTYAVLDEQNIQLRYFEHPEKTIHPTQYAKGKELINL